MLNGEPMSLVCALRSISDLEQVVEGSDIVALAHVVVVETLHARIGTTGIRDVL